MENLTIEKNVKDYNGNNNFILSLKDGLEKYGRLTEKQLNAASNFFTKLNKRNSEFIKSVINPTQKNVNVNIKVGNYIAKTISKDNNLTFTPFLMTITKVLKVTEKAYRVVGKMNTSDVSSCRLCGRDLTDWRSHATGIGPVCSKNLGIPYVRKKEDVDTYKKQVKEKIDKIGDLTFWIPKSQIKEGYDELENQIKNAG